MGIIYSKPDAWQIEVVLLGPGYGESILVHIGDNRWIVIDSCIAVGSKHKRAAALEYFESININPADAVEMIIATHWHDDHIRGLSEIVESCPKAAFVCSSAFTKLEFLGYLKRFSKRNSHLGSSGVRELHKIFSLLSSNETNQKIIMGIEQRRILNVPARETTHGHEINVWALSPSDEQVHKFLDEIGRLLPSEKQTIRRATTASGENHSALVNLINIGELGILLGSDLENQSNNLSGWANIKDNYFKDFPKSLIFKVPHHGSITAFNQDVWNELIIQDAFALLTPWNRGKGLPNTEGIDKIKNNTSQAYITALPGSLKSVVKREAAVEKMIKQATVNGGIRQIDPPYGTIQIRAVDKQLSNWEVNLSQHAKSLADIP